MRLESAKSLFDVQNAAQRLQEFVAGRSWEHDQRDAMLRAGVERKFRITGEALSQLGRRDAGLLARIDDDRRVIAFRNIFTHGYPDADDALAGDIVQTQLPRLRAQVDALLQGAG